MAFGLFPLILFAFIAFPIVEIALLIYVAGIIKFLATLAIVIGTAVLGTILLRRQGFGVISRVNKSMADGSVPVVPVVEGMLLLIAGAFLLTPGLITDSIGFILLVPTFRIAIAKWVLARMLKNGGVAFEMHSSQRDPRGGPFRSGPSRGGPIHNGSGEDVIEGEFSRVDDDPDKRDG